MVEVHVVDAFTQEAGKGNRAGVVLDSDGLTAKQMQDIAAFANFSETAFAISPESTDHDVHVRYFTPKTEVPICGHATIATHFLRAAKLGLSDITVVAKTGAGILPVDIDGTDENRKIVMTQGQAEFGKIIDGHDRETLFTALNISATDLHPNLPIQVVSTGHSKVMIPIASIDTLNALNPDMNTLLNLSGEVNSKGYFVFAIEENDNAFTTYGRMFAPAIGINEDPATGNANGPAGAYLTHHGVLQFDEEVSYLGHQGISMGKHGTLEVRLQKTDGVLSKVQVAGHAVQTDSLEYAL